MEQVAVDEVGEPSFECSAGLARRVAAGDSSCDEGAGVGMTAALGHGDAVDGAVQLPVAGAGQSVACSVA